MLSIRAIYDGKSIHFLEKVDYTEPQEVIITFLKSTYKKVPVNDTKTMSLIEYDIKTSDIHSMIQNGGSFDFLENDEENIYSDNDLKIRY